VAHNESLAGWARGHPATVDAALAGVVLAAFEMPAFDPYRHAGGPLWPLWGLTVALPLMWRRRFPVAVLAVSLVGTIGAVLTRIGPDWGGLSLIAILLGFSVALATAAATVPIELSQKLAATSASAIVATMVVTRSVTPDVLAAQVAVIAGAWLAGEALRARRNEIAKAHELSTAWSSSRRRPGKHWPSSAAPSACCVAMTVPAESRPSPASTSSTSWPTVSVTRACHSS
jgi:hypothetical protein